MMQREEILDMWDSVGQCGSVWVSVGQCGSMWVNVGQCVSVWVSVGLCESIRHIRSSGMCIPECWCCRVRFSIILLFQ